MHTCWRQAAAALQGNKHWLNLACCPSLCISCCSTPLVLRLAAVRNCIQRQLPGHIAQLHHRRGSGCASIPRRLQQEAAEQLPLGRRQAPSSVCSLHLVLLPLALAAESQRSRQGSRHASAA